MRQHLTPAQLELTNIRRAVGLERDQDLPLVSQVHPRRCQGRQAQAFRQVGQARELCSLQQGQDLRARDPEQKLTNSRLTVLALQALQPASHCHQHQPVRHLG